MEMKKSAKCAMTLCAALSVGLTVGAQDATTKVINHADVLAGGVPVASAPTQEPTLKIDLPTAIATAVQQNHGIAIAEEKLAGAKAAIGEAAAAKNPSLAYSFQGAKQKEHTQYVTMPNPQNPTDPRDVITVPVTVDKGFQNAVNVTWPIWTGGAAEGAIAAARLGRDVALLEVYKTEADTKYRATEGYYKLVEARNMQEIADSAVKNLTEHVKNVQAHYRAGVVAKIDVLSSEVALANARENKIKADNGAALAQANLNNIMGTDIATRLAVNDKDLPHRQIGITRDEAIAYAMAHRWELQQAELAVRVAKEKVRIARAGNLPTVALSAGMNWQDKDFPGFKNEDWRVGGGVSWKLFDGGASAAKVEKEKAGIREAEKTLAQAKDAIQLDVIQAYLNVMSAEERIQSTQQVVQQAEEAFKIARVRYRAGVGINLDVLDAQLQLDQARTNYITALYDYNIGLAGLEKAMGVPAVVRPETDGARL